jgi:hypothetical protein
MPWGKYGKKAVGKRPTRIFMAYLKDKAKSLLDEGTLRAMIREMGKFENDELINEFDNWLNSKTDTIDKAEPKIEECIRSRISQDYPKLSD